MPEIKKDFPESSLEKVEAEEEIEIEGKTYHIVYEKGPTSYGASVKELPGCVAIEETLEDARSFIKEAIPEHLQALLGVEEIEINGQKFKAHVLKEDESFVGFVEGIDGANSQGETLEELLKNLVEAGELVHEFQKPRSNTFPIP